MTERKHTVEPWIRAEGNQRYGHTIYALREIASGHRVRGGPPQANVFSAHIQNDNGLATPEELEANAQLMVTAPEMHAALADLIARIERDALIQMRDLMPARRALAHVRGECYQDAGRPCEIHTALGTRRT